MRLSAPPRGSPRTAIERADERVSKEDVVVHDQCVPHAPPSFELSRAFMLSDEAASSNGCDEL